MRQRRNIRSGLGDENKAVGGKREKEKEEVRCEVLSARTQSIFPKELHEGWCEEMAEDGNGSCESVGG